jgi:3-methyl-2-oxobutanoate hydroxymethyltransferase
MSSAWPGDRRITIHDLQAATDRGEHWSMLTSYDTLTAGIFEEAGVRALLVGDTSGEMVLGYRDTLPVTMDQLLPMVQAVVRGTRSALVVAESVNVLGGMRRVQGRGDAGEELLADARMLEEAGAFAVVLESVPADLGRRVSAALQIPTVGIGAGPHCDAQIMVWQDMAGLTTGHVPRFVKRYADTRGTLLDAARQYVTEVAGQAYPDQEHSYA